MPDIDLPVFSFRCNWLEPFTERLSFLTSILSADEGAEQRRIMRLTPRRSFDVDIFLTRNERTFWDLFVSRLGVGELMVPLYWEVVTVKSALVAGVSDRINFDTSSREWQYVELAMLINDSALTYEVVEVAALDANGIDLGSATVNSWPVGTKLLPLRRGEISDTGQPIAITGGMFNVTTRITLTAPNPWEAAVDSSPVYLGLPVFLDEPNWVEPLQVSYERRLVEVDNETGKRYRVDPADRITLGQEHRWFLDGRERLASFRDLIYRHSGRSGGFWLPTFKHDLRLKNSPLAVSAMIQVEKVGFDYIGGPASGREYIAITHTGGTLIRKILSVMPGPGADRETLVLDAALGLDLSPGLVRRISFADTARFDQDDFEITHYGGVDALHECSARFRTFKNTRTAPTPIEYPIAIAEQSSARCGGPAEDPCYDFEAPVFEGFYTRIRLEMYNSDREQPSAGWLFTVITPGTPSSYAIGSSSGDFPNNYNTYLPDFGGMDMKYGVDLPQPQNYRLRQQWFSGTRPPGLAFRMFAKRWDGDEVVLFPQPGSDILADEDGIFTVGGLFPFDYFFVF